MAELLPTLDEVGARLPIAIGVVGRFEAELRRHRFERVGIPTSYGLMDRAFYGKVNGTTMLVVFGRFDKRRGMSTDINFENTQAAFNAAGCKTIIGTFVGGAIQKHYPIGTVFVVDDMYGVTGYHQSLWRTGGYKNVDMYEPFCPGIRGALLRAADEVSFEVQRKGTYVCFHGFPRIETKAELEFYERNGWDIVGQTMDPEATLARESGCCYAALAATMDDPATRSDFLAGQSDARARIQASIPKIRLKTTELLFRALPHISEHSDRTCRCGHEFHKESGHFRYLPDYLLDPE